MEADAVPARVLARELAPQYVLDIHVLNHGASEIFVGHNGARFNNSNFFGPLAADRQNALPLHLCAVYQMSCRGGSKGRPLPAMRSLPGCPADLVLFRQRIPG